MEAIWQLVAKVCVRQMVTQSDVRSHHSASESRLNPLEKVIIRLVQG